MKKRYLVLALMHLIFFSQRMSGQSQTKIWFDRPAQYFEETLVLGNGKIGASVFGDPVNEKIYLNDATLWTGEPVNPNMNPEAYKNIPAIREALKNNDYALAEKLNKKVQGKFSESYAPLGTLNIQFKDNGKAEKFNRELDLANAVSTVSFESNGVKYRREYFISYPDHVMVIKMSASKKGALTFDLNFKSQLKYKIQFNGNTYSATGFAPIHCDPSYHKGKGEPVIFDDLKGTRFVSLFKIKNKDGQLLKTDSTMGVRSATEAIVYISINTSFNGFDKNPAVQGTDYLKTSTNWLNNAFSKSYESVKKSHIEDYQRLFNRVSLNLGQTKAPELTTPERLKRYAMGKRIKI